MKKKLYYIIILNLLPVILFGQGSFYTKDGSTNTGVNLIENTDLVNSQLCQIQTKGNIKSYTPYDISAYGFKSGRVYIAKNIQLVDTTIRVFLERLVMGSTTLYYYKGKGIETYFLERDGDNSLVELNKQDPSKKGVKFDHVLKEITSDCPDVAYATDRAGYNKNSLSKFIDAYNKCDIASFSFPRFGISIINEIAMLNYTPSSSSELYVDMLGNYVRQMDFKYDGGLAVGISFEKSIKSGDFSVLVELLYAQHRFSASKYIELENFDVDFVAEVSSLRLPLSIRYVYPSDKFRPFVNVGGVLTYNFKNDNSLYWPDSTPDSGQANSTTDISLISDTQFGYGAGLGLEYKLNFNYSLIFELRYNKYFSLSNSLNFSESVIQSSVGLKF